MKKLLTFINGYRKEAVMAPLFKMLEALLELFVPVIVKRIIDIGIATSDTMYILKMCGVLFLLALVGLIFSITAQYFSAKAAVGTSTRLRYSLFEHIGTLSYPDIDTLGTSGLITRMTSDVNQVQNGINLTLRLLLRSPFVVFGAMIMAFTVDKVSAVTFAVTIPVLSVVVFAVMLSSMPLYRLVQKRLDKVLSSTRSALNGVRVIRAFGREQEEIKEFEQINSELNLASRKAGRISTLLNPVTYVLVNIAVIVLIYVGALRVDSGIITKGSVVALYNYMSQILVELVKLANLIINISRAVASSKRIEAVFAVKPTVTFPEKGAKPDMTSDIAVCFKNVRFTYPSSSAAAIADVSFSVKKGERIGIIGATGSGKTTIINLIPRFYDPDSGEVLLFGRNVKEYASGTINELVAVVPQKAVLFNGTVKDNLLWGNSDASDEELYEALDIAQGLDIIASKKDGINEVLTEGGKNLSGGQKQRLTIARALVKKAPVLILDDSSSALDMATDRKLRNALSKLDYSPTVFIVSQRISSVIDCDKIIVTDDGNIAGIGTNEELLASCDIYKEIYNSQTKGGVANVG
ncbi:MAG: ABC transporter ATP-binding protein [Clostridiaceae bacterium]|nr:ABC transporter ATP-binding protein [Clostridiaceae bacterium]